MFILSTGGPNHVCSPVMTGPSFGPAGRLGRARFLVAHHGGGKSFIGSVGAGLPIMVRKIWSHIFLDPRGLFAIEWEEPTLRIE